MTDGEPGATSAPIASADIHDPVLAAAARGGAAGAALIGITRAGGERLVGDALEALERRLGAAALAALG